MTGVQTCALPIYPYFNPRAIDRDAILALLRSAHAGLRPTPAGG